MLLVIEWEQKKSYFQVLIKENCQHQMHIILIQIIQLLTMEKLFLVKKLENQIEKIMAKKLSQVQVHIKLVIKLKMVQNLQWVKNTSNLDNMDQVLKKQVQEHTPLKINLQ